MTSLPFKNSTPIWLAYRTNFRIGTKIVETNSETVARSPGLILCLTVFRIRVWHTPLEFKLDLADPSPMSSEVDQTFQGLAVMEIGVVTLTYSHVKSSTR